MGGQLLLAMEDSDSQRIGALATPPGRKMLAVSLLRRNRGRFKCGGLSSTTPPSSGDVVEGSIFVWLCLTRMSAKCVRAKSRAHNREGLVKDGLIDGFHFG